MRTFIAVHLPDIVKTHIRQLQDALRRCGAPLRWVQPENMHLTLLFLGEIDESKIQPICSVLRLAAENHTPFDILFSGLGTFPNRKAPRVLWIGVQEGARPLCNLQQDIQQQITSLQLSFDKKKFHPHVTLGRSKGRPHSLTMKQGLWDSQAGVIHVNGFALIQSQLGGPQPVYTELESFPLHEA